MGNYKVYSNKLNGEVKVPPSKSICHRAIICGSLSDGTCNISNIDYSDDVIATIEAMKSLGAVIKKEKDNVQITGIFSKENSIINNENRLIDCNESGSTLRFLVPISCLFDGKNNFIGRGNLGKRPLDTYYKIFDEQNIKYSYKENILDLCVEGKLKSGDYKVKGNISSQFISGLLFTLPLLNGNSRIIITTRMESKGYIDLTLSTMRDFGIEIINNNYEEFIIKGNQKYKSRDYRVEGDYSQAAFFLCADALSNEVIVNDLNLNSLQGDKEVIDILKRMGVVFEAEKNGIIGKAGKNIKAVIIDASMCPDIIPVLSLVSSLCVGKTIVMNAGRLRIKECDRLSAVASELNKLGARITEKENGMIIEGVEKLKGGVSVWSHKDHRIAMMLAIAGTVTKEPIIIKDYECVSKSYPKFWSEFERLGGNFEEI